MHCHSKLYYPLLYQLCVGKANLSFKDSSWKILRKYWATVYWHSRTAVSGRLHWGPVAVWHAALASRVAPTTWGGGLPVRGAVIELELHDDQFIPEADENSTPSVVFDHQRIQNFGVVLPADQDVLIIGLTVTKAEHSLIDVLRDLAGKGWTSSGTAAMLSWRAYHVEPACHQVW